MKLERVINSLRGEHGRYVRELLAGDWTYVRTTGSGHLQLQHEPTGRLITCARSPSDHRGTRNLRSVVRRIEAGV